jgi:tRNA(Ile)-lysidine synthetase-like protein
VNTPFQKVARFMQRQAMLDGARGVLVAVSGGPDSVALLDMLVRISNPHFPTPIPPLHIAHLDHMLRGRESAEDAEFVRELAAELGLKITINSIDVRAAALRTGRGIEETAREIRYEFLRAASADAGCDRIAVGHTMTDQAETFLMRLVRGAGLRGLAAMRPVVAAHRFREAHNDEAEGGRQKAEGGRQEAEGGRQKAEGQEADNESLPSAVCLLPSVLIIRPLLCITRDEVEAYCRGRHLRFRTDPTNLTRHYTRNRIRTDVLPALAAINPRIIESISRAAEHIAGDQDVLDDLALSLLSKTRVGLDVRSGVENGTIAVYSVPGLLEQKVGLRRRMIIEAIRLARAAAECEECEPGGEVTSVHVEAVDALLTQNATSKHIVLPGLLEAWLEYDTLVFRRSKVKAGYLLSISSEHPAVEADGFAFSLQRGLPAKQLWSVLEAGRQEVKAGRRDWMTVALDDRVLPDDLVIRPRLRGERAQVLGRRRTIKLKKLMIDHRIPSSRRATWPLVTTPDGSYIWSPGLPPAVEFAAHDKTESLAIVRASAI